MASDSFESVVCQVTDIDDGGMKEVNVEGKIVLIAKQGGKFYAIGGKCTHYGAPLVKGVLGENGRIRCPWHGAVFDISTGDIEDYPGLDCLRRYELVVLGNELVIRSSRNSGEKRVRDAATLSGETNQETLLILGGGAAAAVCVETVRYEGYTGRVVMATMEHVLPYDRPKVSKAMHLTDQDLQLRLMSFYSLRDITVLMGKEATHVNFNERIVNFSDGSKQTYSKLFIATGCKPVELDIPGATLDGVLYLRNPTQANHIARMSSKKKVVVIGSSFIALEVACYLADKTESVSLVCRGEVPFSSTLGIEVGRLVRNIITTKSSVNILTNTTVVEVTGNSSNTVESVVLSNGEVLLADVVVVGIGAIPCTGFLRTATGEGTVLMGPKGDVQVDRFMCTSVPGVFAGGDIVSFPLACPDAPHQNKLVNIGHWQLAKAHGRAAALNLIGREKPLRTVPFFWTVFLGRSLRFAGYNAHYDSIVLHPNQASGEKFVAFYGVNGRVCGVASLNFDPIVSAVAEIFTTGRTIDMDVVNTDPWGFKSVK